MLIAVAWTMLMRVAAVAAHGGHVESDPAVLVQDDVGTILMAGWMLTFWTSLQRRIQRLESFEDLEEAIA